MKKKWLGFAITAVILLGFIAFVVSELRHISAPGTVVAYEVININIDFPALVTKVHVIEGQSVVKGDVLLSLDLTGYYQQLKDTEYRLNEARNQLQYEETTIQKLRFALEKETEILNQKYQELKDNQISFAQGGIPKLKLDTCRSEVFAQEKLVGDLKLTLQGKIQGATYTQVLKDKILNLELELAALQNKLSLASINNNAVVTPVSRGIVYDIGYTSGDAVRKDKKVLSILDLDSVIIEALVDEKSVKDIRKNAKVTIIPMADPFRHYTGRVINISDMAVVKLAKTVFIVRVEITDRDSFLMPNLNVEVKIEK